MWIAKLVKMTESLTVKKKPTMRMWILDSKESGSEELLLDEDSGRE